MPEIIIKIDLRNRCFKENFTGEISEIFDYLNDYYNRSITEIITEHDEGIRTINGVQVGTHIINGIEELKNYE